MQASTKANKPVGATDTLAAAHRTLPSDGSLA